MRSRWGWGEGMSLPHILTQLPRNLPRSFHSICALPFLDGSCWHANLCGNCGWIQARLIYLIWNTFPTPGQPEGVDKMVTLTHPEWNQETGGLEVAKAFADQIRGKYGIFASPNEIVVTLILHQF